MILENKITATQVSTNNVKSAPDYYKGTSYGGKDLFDKLPELIVEKHNALIDDLTANGTSNPVISTNITNLKVDNEDLLLISKDNGGTYQLPTSSGHRIKNEYGDLLPQRKDLKFINAEIQDTETATIVKVSSGATGPAGHGVPTGGVAGQILKKTSDISFDTEWSTLPEYAPKYHASSSASLYGKGSGAEYGHVRLSDTTEQELGALNGYAATPKAVKTAYDKGAEALSKATLAMPMTGGQFTDKVSARNISAEGLVLRNIRVMDSAGTSVSTIWIDMVRK